MIFSGKSRSNEIKGRALGIILILPALLFVTFTKILPLLWNFILSFQKWDLTSDIKWVFLKNYINVFNDSITMRSFYNSLYIALVSASIAVISGLILALMIYRMKRVEGAVFRLVFFAPSMLPLAVVALLFSFIYNPDIGLLNNFLRIVGLQSLEHAWLAEQNTVLAAISFTGAWRLSGLSMMLCFTAVTSIPLSLFEAGRIDGANYFKQVFMVILPLIKPTIQMTILLTLVNTFKTYALVWVMTAGGPGNLSMIAPIQMLEVGFSYNEFGHAAAIGMVFSIMVLFFVNIIKRVMRGEVYEY